MTAENVLLFTSIVIIFLWLRIQYKSAQLKQFLQAVLLAVIWVGLLGHWGRHGTFSHFEKFPSAFLLFFPGLILFSIFLAFSKFGTAIIRRVQMNQLVLFQSFRLLAELALFLALKEGLAPVQMTFEGYNFDIVTGVAAVGLGLYLRKKTNTKLVQAFNLTGMTFLAVIAFIAMTSMPNKLRLFMNEPSNIWVTMSPYILLPGILVLAALTTHLLIFRKLKSA